ncbi:DUF5819 family protein [Streptomyces sp. bgisy100]|uniref:DUF5819 family protein n=1 Tax=Streptomyces sp. bgisy100 TaxID=3413783 RepID=UPI003D7569E6
MTATVLLAAALAHLALVFLSIAPANAITARYEERIDAYVYPEFGQDWKLFAPNPMQRNDAVAARVRTRGEDGVLHTWAWVNLTDQDVGIIRGNPAPSHVHQNMLRRAWESYVATHSQQATDRLRSELAADYLLRVALQRMGRVRHGEPVVGLQIGVRMTMVPPPAWKTEKETDTPTFRKLRWWPVTDQDYKGL